MSNLSVTANVEQFLIKIDGLSERLRLMNFTGVEQISRMFHFEAIFAIKGDYDIEPRSVLGQTVTIEILNEVGDHARYIGGIVSGIKQVELDSKFVKYHIEISPQHGVLSFKTNYLVFQNKSFDEIIRAIMDEASIPSDTYRFELSETHNPREYCVQFGETDLAFISRIMEEEGAFYYYEHTEDMHVMVISDHPSVHQAIDGDKIVPYHEMTGLTAQGEYVMDFHHKEAIGTGAAAYSDYNYLKPTLGLLKAKTSSVDTELEIYDFPGLYADIASADRRIKYRVDALNTNNQKYEGKTSVRRMTSGAYFSLTEHPRGRYNQDYLLVTVTLTGSQPGVLEEASGGGGTTFGCGIVTIPLEIPFRSGKTIAKPNVASIQTAVVVGPAGEEIYTDEHGRVKIQFHWDRIGSRDENSSCWVRVSQAWAGAGWGALFLPRIGQEVIVSFVDGDPDRPLITGRVYNADNRPPCDLPGGKNKSTIKSNSTKGGGGSNELRFDDTKGAEEIYLHGQRDWNIVTENDKGQLVGHNENLSVRNDRTKDIGANQSETIGKNKTTTVGADHTESIGKNMAITVGEDLTENIGKNSSATIGADSTISIGGNHSSDIGKDLSLSVGGNANGSIGSKFSITIGSDFNHDVGGKAAIQIQDKLNLAAVSDIQIRSDSQIVLKAGSASITLKSNGDIVIKGNNISVKGDGNVTLKGSKIAGN